MVVWECCGRDDDDFKVPEDVLVHLQAAQPGRSVVCVVCCAFELAVAQSHDHSEEAALAVRLCSTVTACRDSLSAATPSPRGTSAIAHEGATASTSIAEFGGDTSTGGIESMIADPPCMASISIVLPGR